MGNAILSPRDDAVLRLLDRTPATTQLVRKASAAFPGEAFHDERRVRERLQALALMHLVRSFPMAHGIGGPMNWYKLTPDGFRYVHGVDAVLPGKSRFDPISPSRFHHTANLAETIVHVLVSAHAARISVSHFLGDSQLLIDGAGKSQTPDCFFQLTQSGRQFNTMFEVDRATESIDSLSVNAIREKIRIYEAHQDSVWQWWKQQGRDRQRPYFRVVFLTTTVARASHILWIAAQCARNKDRHLCYAATQETFLGSSDALTAPLFNDHHGRWHSLVNLHPSSQFTRTPIRLSPPVTILGQH